MYPKDTNKIIRKWKSNLKEGIQSNFFLKNKINNGWMPLSYNHIC